MPLTGMAVCSGSLGTNVAVGSKVLVWARNAALPVAVGPGHRFGDVWKYWGTLLGRHGHESDPRPGKKYGSDRYRLEARSTTRATIRAMMVVR